VKIAYRRGENRPVILFVILWAVVVLFPISEVALARVKRADPRTARLEDQGSLRLLWIGISIGIALAIAAQWIQVARIAGSPTMLRSLALILMLVGLAVRWTAILMLGHLFTVNVAIHADHPVVEAGLYRYVRHPSYAGLLLAFVGLGVFFANWLSILGLLVPITLAVLNRVAREEEALLASLGLRYAAYCTRTKRFIPGMI
jgi:protein-S-isoprenylcysteine O-methyltransferase Ste14